MNAAVISVTDEDFESRVLAAATPVLVDYWAEWCAPCKMIEPTLYELAAEYDGQVLVAKVNIDDCPTTAQQYNIRGIPTLLLFTDGRLVAAKVGALSKTELKQFVDENIKA